MNENKKTYEELKAAGDMKVADWFEPRWSEIEQRTGLDFSRYIDEPASDDYWDTRLGWRVNFRIERETEKAALIEICEENIYTDNWAHVSFWVPKAAIESYADYKAREDAFEARKEAAFNAGCEKYNNLINWCKEHHVKGVRVGLRTSTIMAKIQAAGLTYAA